MKLLKFNKIIFNLIVVLGIFLRLYKLDSIPPGLTWDEAALGYNAYSISQTLKDEYGNFLPLTLKSFGDYKPALYAYLDIPFILLLGLNEWAVRLPSAFAGIGFILICYLITKEIFKNERLSLSVAFFASISPLSIQFSRAGYESNVAVFLNLLGLYFFLKAGDKSKYYFASAAAFILSLTCYQGSKIYVPIIITGLFFFYRNQIKISRNFIFSFIAVLISLICIYFSTFFLGQSDRLTAQNFFAYQRSEEQINLVTQEDGIEKNSLKFGILHGEWWEYTRGLIYRYLVYFSPKTLFVDGDYSPRHSIPDLGILNYYGLVFIPFGFYLLWKKRENEKKIILFWLFTASLPGVFSRDLISMVRSLNLVFPFVILEGFGFYYLVKKISANFHLKYQLTAAGLLFLIFLNLVYYLDFYFIHLPKENSSDWLYGYKQVISKLPDISKYSRVIFTDQFGQPYIYYLFYTKYSPEKFQAQAKLVQETVDVGTVRKIDNIEFMKINWPRDRGLENTLFIASEDEIPEQDIPTEKKSKEILQENFLDGKPAFKIVENGYE